MLPALVPILILLPSDNRNNVACGATTLGASGRRSPREPSASPTHNNFAHSEATMETKDAMALCMVRLLIGTAGCSRPSVLLPVQFFNGRAGR